MKAQLKDNWSDQFGYEKAKSELVFVGRDREVKSLKHALLNNKSSTILVSSVRGVGKTSFVHKVLSEIRGDIIPVFVNVGHSLKVSTEEKSNASKSFLVSLIRAAYLAEEFKGDKEIEKLYYQSIGSYHKEEELTSDSSSSAEVTAEVSSKENLIDLLRQGVALTGVALATLGITIDATWAKVIGVLGILSLSFSLEINAKFAKKIAKAFRVSDGYKLDNTPAYLETKFEQWLEAKTEEKNKKLVFLIDELDQDNEASLNAIKEYKNLFARSFAHFIFISNQEAFTFTQQKRSDSKYPTVFTHVYYLPTPTSEEVRSYLQNVLEQDGKVDNLSELENYLLFRASNDFFSLKNLINDLSEFDSSGKQFIDIETLKKADRNYTPAAKVYSYIDCFYKYYSRTPKLYWLSNSKLQEEIFLFAQENLNKSFSINLNDSENITKLVMLLSRVGAISNLDLEPEEEAVHSEESPIGKYGWTGEFRDIDALDQLFPEDEEFIASMKELIQVANNIDDLPKVYKDGVFDEYDEVFEAADGEALTGISLYNVYLKNKELYEKLLNPEQRLYSQAESVKEATKEIRDTLKNVLSKQLQIFLSALDLAAEKEDTAISSSVLGKGIPTNFEIGSWAPLFAERQNRLFFSESPSRQLLVLSAVTNFSSNREVALAELRSRGNIHVLNLYDISKPLPLHPTIHRDAAGRKRRKKAVVDNFTSFGIPVANIQDLAKPLKLAVQHLTSG